MIGQDGFRIRRAVPVDGAEIARIHVDAWRDAYAALLPPEYLAKMNPRIEAARWGRAAGFNRRTENTLVADADGEIAGYGVIGPARSPTRSPNPVPSGEVYALYVEAQGVAGG